MFTLHVVRGHVYFLLLHFSLFPNRIQMLHALITFNIANETFPSISALLTFGKRVKAISPNAHNFHGRSRMFVIFDEYAAYTSRNKKPRKSQNYDFCCCSVELFGSKFVASKTDSASEVYCVCGIEQEQSAPL